MTTNSGRWRLFASASVLVLTLASCSSNGDGDDGGSFTFVGAGGSYQEAQTIAFIEPFMAETGVTIHQHSPLSYSQLRAQVDAGNVTWDVMEAFPYFAHQYCGEYLEKIDYDVVDVSRVEEGLWSDCAVPNMKSAFILVYNTDTYGDNPPQSWVDFFDTENFPGTRAVQNDVNQATLEVALLADGVAPEDLYPIDYDRAFAKLDTIRDDLVFMESGADQQEAMTNGSVDMVLAWPGRAYEAAANGAPIAPVWNQAIFYHDVFVVPKGTKNYDLVMEFLAYVVTAEAQETLTENIPYAPINVDAEPDVSELERAYLPLGQDEGTGLWRDEEWWAGNLDEATERWTEWAAS